MPWRGSSSQAASTDWAVIGWGALFFVVCIAAVDLIPIPAWEDIELSLSFPIMIGVAMLYSPPVAGMIAIIGSSDIHELRHETGFLRSVWNRSQMALAIVAGSMVFHQFGEIRDPWWILIPAALAGTIAAYGRPGNQFTFYEIDPAVKTADVVMILLPDELHRAVWESEISDGIADKAAVTARIA